jgi:hypothetical protein
LQQQLAHDVTLLLLLLLLAQVHWVLLLLAALSNHASSLLLLLLYTIVCRQSVPALQEALPTRSCTIPNSSAPNSTAQAAYCIAHTCCALAGLLEEQQPHLPADTARQLHSLALLLAIPHAPGKAKLCG